MLDENFFDRENIRVIFSGKLDNLRSDVINAMNKLMDRTKNNTNGILNICLNYGGQTEMVDAAKKVAEDYKNNNFEQQKEYFIKQILFSKKQSAYDCENYRELF